MASYTTFDNNSRKESVKEMVDNWIGGLFDKQGNLIIKK